jgi:hypothetical protein
MYGGEERCIKVLVGKYEVDMYGRIILKWILEE